MKKEKRGLSPKYGPAPASSLAQFAPPGFTCPADAASGPSLYCASYLSKNQWYLYCLPKVMTWDLTYQPEITVIVSHVNILRGFAGMPILAYSFLRMA